MDAQPVIQTIAQQAGVPQFTPEQTLFFAWSQFGVQSLTAVVVVKLLWEVRRLHHRFSLVWNWYKREHSIDDSEE